MKTVIISSMLTALGIYVYLAWVNRKRRSIDGEKRSGGDRRKTFNAAKNKMRRSGKDRRGLMNRPIPAQNISYLK
jgi:hypothetical protein